ncbi:unnamed protein product [Linum tenue]|uniref:MADS-box domain-containing protein n=1 Tax=Linum tenue TaxID=586396 RepID=A0AAV0J9F2_9ROSI|nr:unnamed protein product [Linum tenue]
MPRDKVKLEWIEDEAERRAALRKRCAGLVKKVTELTTMCGVSGMCLIYGLGEEQPTVWPSHDEAKQMLMRSSSLSSKTSRSKNMTDQKGYLRNAVLKAQENQRKQLQKLRNMELTWLMNVVDGENGLDKLETSQVNSLAGLIHEKIQEIRKRIGPVGSNPPGRVEGENQEDRKPDLEIDYMAIMNQEAKRRRTVGPSDGEEGSSGPELGLRLGRDGDDVGSEKATADVGGLRELDLFPGGMCSGGGQ